MPASIASQAAEEAKESPTHAIVSYDEKPACRRRRDRTGLAAVPAFARLRAIPNTTPVPSACWLGIDLLTGKITPSSGIATGPRVHRVSQTLMGYNSYRDQGDPRQSPAHISKETRGWLAAQRSGRFEFVFTPAHGSWLNLIEGFFSKLARSVLRHIRVASKQELKDRIMAAIEIINHQPVVHIWSYMLNGAA